VETSKILASLHYILDIALYIIIHNIIHNLSDKYVKLLRFNYFVFRAFDLSMRVALKVATLLYKMCCIRNYFALDLIVACLVCNTKIYV